MSSLTTELPSGLPAAPAEATIARLRAELQQQSGLTLIGNEAAAELKRCSRDYYDYSPVLRPLLQHRYAQLVAKASSTAAVVAVAAACSRYRVPLTCRGSGTGNYGQCVPLAGGVVLDLTGLNRLRHCDAESGVIEVEAGCVMGDLERQLAACGRALRLVPSTVRSATIGGFIAGGSGGIGSMRWGFLRDPGNLLGLEVVTLEPEPRTLRLDATASEALNHAYGTNGIVTALELPTCPALDWHQLVVGFHTWDAALTAAQTVQRSALELNLLTVLEAEVAAEMPWPAGCTAPQGEHRLLLQASAAAMRVLPGLLRRLDGELIWHQPRSHNKGIPLHELSWNHTTLHWRSTHSDWTYLQLLLPQPEGPCLDALRRRWGGSLRWHLEAVRHQGSSRLAAVPLVAWQGEEPLKELMAHCQSEGCVLFSPHVLTVEDGGLGVIDSEQVKAKLDYDPAGLLNPGKLRGWWQR